MSYGEDDLRTALSVLERLAPAGDPAAAAAKVQDPTPRSLPRVRLAAVAGAVAVVLAIAVGLVFAAHRGHPRAAAPPSSPSTSGGGSGLSARLVLSSLRVSAGTPLTARLIVDNFTGHPIQYRGNCNAVVLRIALTNRTHPASFPLVPCPSAEPVRTLPSGRTTISLTFRTWEGYCGGTASICGPDGQGAALPPGVYHTAVSWPAPLTAGVPEPEPVAVTLTAR